MLKSLLLLAALPLAACVEPLSSGPLPEGRYQLTWTALDDAGHAQMPLVREHHVVVHAGQLVFGATTIPLSFFDDQCACTEPVGDIPAFHICVDQGTMSS